MSRIRFQGSGFGVQDGLADANEARRRRVRGLILGISLFAAGAGAQEGIEIPDAAVEAQLAAFEVADGFEISLFASDPMIAKPVQMNWDTQGRLWVVSSAIYPQIEPGAEEKDQVIILEDTNGDGVADTSTVFADDLYIPTGVMPVGDGAYVANSTQVLYLGDADGDGVADSRRVVLSGFGTEDTHHLLHTFRWGPGGRLYFNQSIYIHSHIETPYGVRRLLGGGIWEYRPETRRLEVVSKGLVNPWGHVFDEWGHTFATDGAGFEGINHVFPGSVFKTAVGESRVLPGLNTGQPKHCGLEVISGRHFPDDWQGDLVAPDFRGNRVNRFKVEPQGSSFRSVKVEDVVASTHRSFRPIDVRMGPDGALYIADWYNPIIQHGEVDFRDERRDRVHGRIWRVTAKGRDFVEKPEIAGASVETLLESLKAPEAWTREMAKRELKGRGEAEVLPALEKWIAGLAADEEHALLEGLWVYQSLDVVKEDLLRQVASSAEAGARSAALRVLLEWTDRVADAEAIFAEAVSDEDAQVRLAAVTGLRAVGTATAMEAALEVLDAEMDETLDFALWLALRETEGAWMAAYEQGEVAFAEKPKQLLYAMRAVGSGVGMHRLKVNFLVEEYRGQDLSDFIGFVGEVGSSEELEFLFDRMLVAEAFFEGHRAEVMTALANAARLRKVVPSGDVNRVAALLDSEKEAEVLAAAELAGAWRSQAARPKMVALLKDPKRSGAFAKSVAMSLARMGGGLGVFKNLGAPDQPYRLRALAAQGAFAANPQTGAALLVEILGDAPNANAASPIVGQVFSNRQGPKHFMMALKGKELSPEVARLALQRAGSSGLSSPELEAALKEAGNLKAMVQELSPEAMAALVAKVQSSGDAHRGEIVYRKKELQCAVCHAIGPAGGLVGPNMVSIGASAPEDYLIESLLNPNAKIKEGFHMTLVTLKNGQAVAGSLVSDGATEMVVRDAAGVEQRIAKADVAQSMVSPVSMMPMGLTASLREDEFVDLVRFLSELGKEGDFKVGTRDVVRNWRSLQPLPRFRDDVGFYGMKMFAKGAEDFVWFPAYSTVEGVMPLEDMTTFAGRSNQKGKMLMSVLQFRVEVLEAGSVILGIPDLTGVHLWVGEEDIAEQEEVRFDLEKGKHVVTVVVNQSERKAPLEIELLKGGEGMATLNLLPPF